MAMSLAFWFVAALMSKARAELLAPRAWKQGRRRRRHPHDPRYRSWGLDSGCHPHAPISRDSEAPLAARRAAFGSSQSCLVSSRPGRGAERHRRRMAEFDWRREAREGAPRGFLIHAMVD